MSQKRHRSSSPDLFLPIFTSSAIEDRSSKFVAFYSPTLSTKELQAHSELKSSSHRFAAWRNPSSQRALNSHRLLDIGHDDDGEKYGGKAVEKVLVEMDVKGAVVVARWYGGVMLGPVRFDHIKNSARDAIMQFSQERERSAKRAKVQEDHAEKQRLIQTLPERDESITVLRGLLAEKSQQSSSTPGSNGTPAKTPDYSILPLATLQKLEQVRDATIGWILKQIEKAENAHSEGLGADTPAVPITETPKASPHLDEHPSKNDEPQTTLKIKNAGLESPKPDGI